MKSEVWQAEFLEIKVCQYNENYQDQFTRCREMMKTYSSASVEKQVIGGIGNASRALGKLIAATPILSKGPVDEWLQSGGDMLLKGNAAGAEKTAAALDMEMGVGNEMFIDSIRNVETICSHTTGVLFDREALYLTKA